LVFPMSESQKTDPKYGRMRVLAVEDNSDCADTLEILLTMNGFKVRTASCGKEALAVIERFTPQVVILDVHLPGMDGVTLAHILRRQPDLAGVPFVALSGYTRDQIEQLHPELPPFDQYLLKPVPIEELVRVLAEAVPNGRGGTDGPVGRGSSSGHER
jgi:CheY-like chemotaxis protein